MSSQVQPDAAANTTQAAPGSEAQPAANPSQANPTETPPPGATPADPAKPAEAAKPQEGNDPNAPKEVKYDLKAPEGIKVEAATIQSVETLAKKMNLSNEQAQELLNNKAAEETAFQTLMAETVKQNIENWANEAKADTEIGGDRFNETVALSHGLIERLATPKLKEELNKTGFGNHPEVIRLFSKAAREIGILNDKLVQAGIPASPTKRSSDVLYDKK